MISIVGGYGESLKQISLLGFVSSVALRAKRVSLGFSHQLGFSGRYQQSDKLLVLNFHAA